MEAHLGDLLDGVPQGLRGTIDLVVAVPPFVPTGALAALAPEVRATEPSGALDGGSDGMDLARRLADDAPSWLRRRGAVVIEVGPGQVEELASHLASHGYVEVETVVDEDGDPCGVAAVVGS